MIISEESKELKWAFIEWGLKLLIYALTLMMATIIFKGFYISGFMTAVLTSLMIMLLNITVKPFLKIIALPINLLTLGIFYPFLDVIILKIASLFVGNNFIVEGWIVPFFIAIFISLVTVLLDGAITKKIIKARK